MDAKTTEMHARLTDVKGAATYLSVSPWTVREMVWRGDLPAVRVGRLVRLDLRDLDAWIDRQKHRNFEPSLNQVTD